jgi:hypothetical protein
MLAQPRRQSGGLAVRQHVEAAVGDRVDQHGGVLATSPDREIIDTEHRHRAHLGIGQRMHQTQQRVPARHHPQQCRQA